MEIAAWALGKEEEVSWIRASAGLGLLMRCFKAKAAAKLPKTENHKTKSYRTLFLIIKKVEIRAIMISATLHSPR